MSFPAAATAMPASGNTSTSALTASQGQGTADLLAEMDIHSVMCYVKQAAQAAELANGARQVSHFVESQLSSPGVRKGLVLVMLSLAAFESILHFCRRHVQAVKNGQTPADASTASGSSADASHLISYASYKAIDSTTDVQVAMTQATLPAQPVVLAQPAVLAQPTVPVQPTMPAQLTMPAQPTPPTRPITNGSLVSRAQITGQDRVASSAQAFVPGHQSAILGFSALPSLDLKGKDSRDIVPRFFQYRNVDVAVLPTSFPEPDKLYKCCCGKRFANKSKFVVHADFEHLGISIPCPTCGKRFATLSQLDRHRHTVHHYCTKHQLQLHSTMEMNIHFEEHHARRSKKARVATGAAHV